MILTDTMNEHQHWLRRRREEPTKWLIPISRAHEFIELPASQIGDDLADRIRAEGPLKALRQWRGVPVEWTGDSVLRLV